jgi:predicted acyl esterase
MWIRSPPNVNDADLQVSLTEVRPDGQERYVQSGWLRASLRKLASSATDLWPEHTYAQQDQAFLVPGQWTAVRVGIPAFGHVFRAGSSLRVIVDTPGGTRAQWTFANDTFPGTVLYDVATSTAYPSSVLLPVLQGVASTTPLPPCPSLRAEECRAYAAYTNTASAP